MARALILLLPRYAADAPGAIRQWWLVEDGAVIDSGDDGAWPDLTGADADFVTIALAPAEDAPVHFQMLPGLTPLQARAAASVATAERVLGGAAHIASSLPDDDGVVTSCAVTHAAMAQWIAALDAAQPGVAAIVPLAALLPAPAEGAALHAVLGEASILRTATLSAAADPELDALRVQGLALVHAAAVDGAGWLAALADAVPLDLLIPPYARAAPSALTPETRRWLVRFAAALAVLTLAVPVAQAWQRQRSIAAADARALAAAARAGVIAPDAAAAEIALDQRLAARGGGPLALSAPLGGLYRSLQAQASVAVRSMAHLANGTLSVTLAAPRIDDVNAVLADLQARGFIVTGQPLSGSDGMQMASITIRAVP
jgi:general secretion pathway protein L